MEYQNKTNYGGLIVVTLLVLSVGIYIYHTYFYTLPVSEKELHTEVFVTAANYNDNGEFDKSQQYLENQIQVNPAVELKLYLANSILNEGSVLSKEVESSEAAQKILSALEVEGHASVYFYDLYGYSYEIINNFTKAHEYYEKALAMDPNSVNTLFSIGHTYWLSGDIEKAREYYTQAENNISGDTDTSVQVKVYVAQGRMSTTIKDAEQYYLKAIPLTTSKSFKSEIYANLSALAYIENDLPKALQHAHNAIEADPTSEMGYLAYARASLVNPKLSQEELPKIAAYLMKSVFFAPKKAETQYWIGRMNLAMGAHTASLDSYARAKQLLPDDNSINNQGRQELLVEILLYEAVALYLSNNDEYIARLDEVFNINPVKTLRFIDNDVQLHAMKTELQKRNTILSSIEI